MAETILRNPPGYRTLAKEIKKVVDLYWARKMSEGELKEFIVYWAQNHGEKLFAGNGYNTTISQVVGKKRLKVVDNMLKGVNLQVEIRI